MQTLTVSLAERSYPIFLGSNTVDQFIQTLVQQLPDASRFALVTNTTVAKLYAPLVQSITERLKAVVHVLADGERYKTVEQWSEIVSTLLNSRLDRRSVVIAFGGGVVGDMTGFAAAATLRGIDFVQLPTTLLSMVDSSVGGKTGINHPMGKNLIGAFHQPRLVYIDTNLLATLPRREFVGGYAELFKTAFIGGREMFDFIMQHNRAILDGDASLLQEGIARAIGVKAAVVSADETEQGRRALLNFGHTFGHALEHFFHFESIIHGEGVWWGIQCACEMARRTQMIPAGDHSLYTELLARMPLPPLPQSPDPQALYKAMFSDKKTIGGRLRFILPGQPGESHIVSDCEKPLVMDTLKAVFSR
jgi:3-dehydroquinate synthase